MTDAGYGPLGLIFAVLALRYVGPGPDGFDEDEIRAPGRLSTRVLSALAALCWVTSVRGASAYGSWLVCLGAAFCAYIAFFIGPPIALGVRGLARYAVRDLVAWSAKDGAVPTRSDDR